ncbi:putative iron-regulated membrane protein [Rheinheimera pacifica]|uniref:PepSY-associated TM helix domain-containing protein n=1 Tax=Rheinheimera pacifica TaxID=173990 RepID=UPI00285615BC|nr:PepSY-associated TM helix domain-containing protein [Rheinheimera pacifica]MDR6982022.1 putative iron-regulated membrane protein [Rheinheimera pacifica]
MKARFRDSMTWLHTWSGLVVGWVLFAVFLTGTLAFFQHEITDWMQPELQHKANPEYSLAQAQAFLQQKAPDSARWSVSLPDGRSATTSLFWRDAAAGGRGFRRATLDGNGEEVALRDSRGGSFLYRFHFDLHYMPVLWARWLVGICTMFMLVAIISGVIIHKKIFKDFFSFQPGKGPRSWLDAHTITAVLALPFHLMITYTGLVTLMFMYLSWAISLGFGDRNALFENLTRQPPAQVASGESAAMLPLQQLYQQAKLQLSGAPVAFVAVEHPGDAVATVQFTEGSTQSLTVPGRTLIYSAVNGELLHQLQPQLAAEHTRRTMVNLHAGRFAGLQLRWLYFISGVMGTLMIATGLVLWSEKRLQKLHADNKLNADNKITPGQQLVRWLNVGVILGLPLAVAAYFYANRLLPLALENRAEMEIHCFFAGWALMLLYPLLRGISNSWREGALLTALAYLGLPLLSVLTVQRNILSYRFPADTTLLAVDVMLLLSAGGFFLLWRFTARRKAAAEQRSKTAQELACR